MRSITTLALLVVLVSSTQLEFFDMLSTKDFGKTIIQAIQLELGQENSVDRVLGLLRNMLESANQEQAETNSNINRRQQSCAVELGNCDEIIAKATAKAADDDRQIPLREEELQDKKAQADAKNSEEQRNLDRLTAITQERQNQKGSYDERRDELVGMIAALQDAKNIIKQLKKGSFLQISESIFTEVKEHHQSFLKSYPNQRGFHQLVSILLETLTDAGIKADGNAVDTIMGIMDDLIKSLYDVQKQEMEADDSRELDFISQRARILAANEHLSHQIATLKADVLKLQQKLLELNNDIAAQRQVAQKKTVERQDWLKACTDEQSILKREVENRAEEIEVLQQVVAIFESGFTEEARQHLAQLQIKSD